MLLKAVRNTYDNYVAEPTSDHLLVHLHGGAQGERYQRNMMVRDLAHRAIPFTIEPIALDLISTVQSGAKLVEDFGPLLAEAPLPFDTTWMEFEEDIEGGRLRSGLLIHRHSNTIFAFSFHQPVGQQIIEPLLFLSLDAAGKLDVKADPFTAPRYINDFEGNDDERVSRFFAEAFPQTGWAIVNSVGAMHLITAKGGPLDADVEPMFSRPERRRMQREGALAVGPAPTVTKIRVNDQGRLHLQAVDDEEGGSGGARRRAHRVRGHYMRSAKGYSWRTAHVRGLGKVNETVRAIGRQRLRDEGGQ